MIAYTQITTIKVTTTLYYIYIIIIIIIFFLKKYTHNNLQLDKIHINCVYIHIFIVNE